MDKRVGKSVVNAKCSKLKTNASNLQFFLREGPTIYSITVFQVSSQPLICWSCTQIFETANAFLINRCIYLFFFSLHGFKVEIKTAKTTVNA